MGLLSALAIFFACILPLATCTIREQQTLLDSASQSLGTCSLLAFHLPGRVFFPNNAEYHDELEAYWSLTQAELQSSCRFNPWSSNDLQQAMLVISRSDALFAIKSGGHSVVGNTSNIDNGIVIDLALLNHVTLHSETGLVDVGAGARWTDVYTKLERSKYSVIGARSGSVGVGGYLLGGGLSVYNNEAGWACDNVDMFEAVLANGTLLEIDGESHPDLFIALKGGGSNFGIVSRVRLKLLLDRQVMDVAFVQYDSKALPEVLNALHDYNSRSTHNENTSASISIGGQFDNAPPSISAVFTHPSNVLSSTVLAPFFSIPHHITEHRKMTQLQLANIYDEMNPPHYRQHRTTLTIHNHATAITAITNNYITNLYPDLSSIAANDTSSQSGILIQPLTIPHLTRAKSATPNMLGLQAGPSTQPLLLISIEARHLTSSNDAKIQSLLSNFIQHADDTARLHGAAHDFKYLNYADASHDAFAHARGDGALWTKVLDVKRRYDPENVFGRQMRHPFKIEYTPNDWCGTGPGPVEVIQS